MDRIEAIINRISRILNAKRCAVLLGIFFLLTMIPVLYVAPAVRATGDDLGYSAGVHQALLNGEGLAGAGHAIILQVISSWYSWQGTWSSITLFCLQPGLLGDEWYPLTVAISLACILGGTCYFLAVSLKRMGFPTAFRWIVFFLVSVMGVQYMPYPRGGIYWWTSVAHYCIPYCAALFCMGWSLRWLDTGKKRYFIGITILMTYLGGAGYPALVLAAVWTFLMILGGALGIISDNSNTERGKCKLRCPIAQKAQRSAADSDSDNAFGQPDGGAISDSGPRCRKHNVYGNNVKQQQNNRAPEVAPGVGAGNGKSAAQAVRIRSFLLLLPFVLEMIGFVISAMAPGNSNRGGEGFGFSVSNVIYTLVACVRDGLTGGIGYFLDVRPLIVALIVIAVFAWEMAPLMSVRNERGKVKAWQPILTVLIGFGISCIVRAPEIYAAAEVSGGVPDTYWFVTLTAMAVCLSYICAWGRNCCDSASHCGEEKEKDSLLRRDPVWSPVVLLGAGLICLLLSRYMIGATVDYTIYNFVISGAYEDYQIQMAEWLDILNDPEISDAELPAMNSEQGPFMLMVPTDDTDSFTNSVYAEYYGKNSVIMVERDKEDE